MRTVAYSVVVLAVGGLWLGMILVMSLLGTVLRLAATARDY